MCVRCQVGSKNGNVVCDELVGSAVGAELLKKNLEPPLVQKLFDQQMI